MHLAGGDLEVAQTAQGGSMNEKARMTRHRAQRGFSMTELVIVVGIILVVAAVAIPNGIRVWYNMELRATADQVASLMQQGRLLAAKSNAYYVVCYRVNQGVQQVYLNQTVLTNTTPCTFVNGNTLTIDLPRQITAASAAPTGSSPSAYTLSTDTTSGTPCDNTCTLAFSPRGLPCKLDTSASTCSTPASTYFVYYFNEVSSSGFGAVLVTKAGRTRAFTWNGSGWN
jgi:prepilin-type N-terminal cleavage/methylation domain-containing protein